MGDRSLKDPCKAVVKVDALFARRTLVRIRKAPHTWRPELIRPTSLILAYRERAAGTGVSVIPPKGLETIMVTVIIATPIAVANLFDG